MRPVKRVTQREAQNFALYLDRFPNAGPRPNVTGMRRIYGPHAYLIKCGQYLYNVPREVYERL